MVRNDLEDLIAERYRGFVSFDEVISSISEKYKCSMGEASLIVIDALESALAQEAVPSLYERWKLRPRLVGEPEWIKLITLLAEAYWKKPPQASPNEDYQKYLCRQEEINGTLERAGYAIGTLTPDSRKAQANDIPASQNDATYVASLEAQLADMKNQLKEANAELERLSALVPPYPNGLMGLAIETQRKYWADRGAKAKSSHPKQGVIVTELREKHGLSELKARSVEIVACPITRGK